MEVDVTLGLFLAMSDSKECPMNFIAVRGPHCQSEQIVKRGKTHRGTHRYLCHNTACTTGSFLLAYRNRGCLPEVKHTIVVQFIVLCSASNLAEVRWLSSPLQDSSPAKTRASSRPARAMDTTFDLLQTARN